MLRWFFLLLLVVSSVKGRGSEELLDELIRSQGQFRIKPQGPVLVQATIFINHIVVREELHECELDIFYRETWQDPRLTFDNEEPLVLEGDFANHVWTPDTYALTSKKVYHFDFQKPNKYVKIDGKGNVKKSQKFLLTVDSPMDFMHFPFDENTISIPFESYAFMSDGIILKWGNSQDSVNIGSVVLPEHQITKGYTTEQNNSLSTGNATEIVLHIDIRRKAGAYFLWLFFPTTLTLSLFWLSSWFERDSPHTYYGLFYTLAVFFFYLLEVGISFVPPELGTETKWDIFGYHLTKLCSAEGPYLNINQSDSANEHLVAMVYCWYAPKLRVTYMTSMSLWIFVCFIYGFLVIFESALAAILAPNYSKVVKGMDWVSRFLFPILLIIVIIVYLLLAGLI